jgi:hypothetical protein
LDLVGRSRSGRRAGRDRAVIPQRSRESPVVAPPPPPPRPKAPEPPLIERDLQALRGLLAAAPKDWNTREIDALFRSATDRGGAGREDVDRLRKDYQRGLRLLDLREGLVGRWPLDDTDGAEARDASGRGAHAKIVGNPGRVPGRIGGAFQFRGADDYVELPGGRVFDIRLAACYTICAWFMPENIPPGKGPAADAHYAILVRNGFHVGLSLAHEGHVSMSHWLLGNKGATASSTERSLPKRGPTWRASSTPGRAGR